jgi:hypothetical protein
MYPFRNKASFYGDKLLTLHLTLDMEDHPLSAAHYCLFNISAATLHITGRFSIRNMRTRHAVVRGTHFHGYRLLRIKFSDASYKYVNIKINHSENC